MVKPTSYRDRDGVLHPATDEHRERCAPCQHREATDAPMVPTPGELARHNEAMRNLREQLSPPIGTPMTADDETRDKLVAAVHQARGEGFLDEDEVQPLLAWLGRAADALSADPADMPEGPERTAALRQMLIDTMSAVEQTDDCQRMAAALDAFDAKDAELKEPPAPCEHVFSDADGRTRYTFCHRGCGARDPAEPPAAVTAAGRTGR